MITHPLPGGLLHTAARQLQAFTNVLSTHPLPGGLLHLIDRIPRSISLNTFQPAHYLEGCCHHPVSKFRGATFPDVRERGCFLISYSSLSLKNHVLVKNDEIQTGQGIWNLRGSLSKFCLDFSPSNEELGRVPP